MDGALQRLDQQLGLEEFVARALRVTPIEGSGQHFDVRVTILDHALAGFLQRVQSFVHRSSACTDNSPARSVMSKAVTVASPDSERQSHSRSDKGCGSGALPAVACRQPTISKNDWGGDRARHL